MGRLDWWNVRAEHNAWEWAAQRAMYEVCPFGEKRDDLRQAINTLAIARSVTWSEVSEDDCRNLLNNLCDYLPCDKQHDITAEADMNALERMKRKVE